MNNAYMGSSFDDFLQEEGIAIEVKNEAIKSLISYNLFKEMQEQKKLVFIYNLTSLFHVSIIPELLF